MFRSTLHAGIVHCNVGLGCSGGSGRFAQFVALIVCDYRAYGHQAAMAPISTVPTVGLLRSILCAHAHVQVCVGRMLEQSWLPPTISARWRVFSNQSLALPRDCQRFSAGEVVQVALRCESARLQAVLRAQQPRSQRAFHEERPIPGAVAPAFVLFFCISLVNGRCQSAARTCLLFRYQALLFRSLSVCAYPRAVAPCAVCAGRKRCI